MIKIENKQQYYAAMARIESYLQKGFSNLTKTEEKRLDELSNAVEAWEIKEYPMPIQPSFTEILVYVMHKKHLNQTQLSQTLEVSKSLLSEVLNGKKQPNVDLLKNLHLQFHIDGNILLQSLHTSKKIGAPKKTANIRNIKKASSMHTSK